MPKLTEIKPTPFSSALQTRGSLAAWIVGGAVALPAVTLETPYRYIVLGVAVVTGIGVELLLSRYRQKRRVRNATTPPREFPDPFEFDVERRTRVWEELTADPAVRSLTLFSYGTCVVSVDEVDDPAENAKNLLAQVGCAIPGTPSADMLVYELPDSGDFVVGCHHPNVLTFVSRDIFDERATTEQLKPLAGTLGRDFRSFDGFAQNVIHVQQVVRDENAS